MRKASLQDLITQVNHFRDGGRPGFSFFLGAGASKTSGVPLAEELADRAFGEMFTGHFNGPGGHVSRRLQVLAWVEGQSWYDISSKSRYQLAMERAFLSHPARATFLKRQL